VTDVVQSHNLVSVGRNSKVFYHTRREEQRNHLIHKTRPSITLNGGQLRQGAYIEGGGRIAIL
jgi:hypothetical protein